MGCKDDNTCDQPATKGEIESLMAWGFFALGAFAILLMRDNKQTVAHSGKYGTVGGVGLSALNDQHAIRELLDESPEKRKASILFHKAKAFERQGFYEENDPENPAWSAIKRDYPSWYFEKVD